MVKTSWIIKIDNVEAESAIDWAYDFVSHYDTSRLAEIRIGKGRGNSRGVYGRCWYPSASSSYYRISCQVPGPFPYQIETRKPPMYRLADGSWPLIPAGCRGGLFCQTEVKGEVREWRRLLGYTEVQTVDEGIVWIVAHEMFHFLRQTRQVEGRNTEIEADKFADEQLSNIRSLRARWTRKSRQRD